MENMTNIECYQALGRAVLIRSILDYQDAQKALRFPRSKRKTTMLKRTISECEEFFNSDYCRVISGVDGKRVLREIRQIKLPKKPQDLEKLIFETNTARFLGERRNYK